MLLFLELLLVKAAYYGGYDSHLYVHIMTDHLDDKFELFLYFWNSSVSVQ